MSKVPVMNRCVIFDVDGTLMNINHRRHHVQGDNKDWKQFNAAMVFDTMNDHVFHLAHALKNDGYSILVFSGRKEQYRDLTESQLKFGNLEPTLLWMRPDDNYEPDHVLKKEFLDNARAAGFNPKMVVDDRPSVVQMWRDNGLTCFDVGGFE